jgi:hypothetical protein
VDSLLTDLKLGIPSGTTFSMPPSISTSTKVHENRVRRMASRQGLVVQKSGRRDPRALDYGLYWLFEIGTDALVSAEEGMTLDQTEAWLLGEWS